MSDFTHNFILERTEYLTLAAQPPLSEMYTLSPFVWRDSERWEILLRAVPRCDEEPALKIACAYYGVSADGLHFVMDETAALAPGPGEDDRDGCEDPTVAIWNNVYSVYYTGWNQSKQQGNLLLASGPDLRHLTKQGIRLAATPEIDNPKEATIVWVKDGTWRLFFEYADGGASKIGIASAPAVDGPWTVQPPLFEARPDRWDCWHLSTGPILLSDLNRPIMFYNGATQDARWRIGWVAFDSEYTQIVGRGEEPLIVPPTPDGERTDIAFASSAVETEDAVYLYYSIADQDMVRAVLRRGEG